MSTEAIKERILEILDSAGITIDKEEYTQDLDLRDYVSDSIQFISFMMEIEDTWTIVLPSEVLLPETLASLNGLCNMIEELINSADRTPSIQPWDIPETSLFGVTDEITLAKGKLISDTLPSEVFPADAFPTDAFSEKDTSE